MMLRVAGVGCLFKIEQFFKSPEATLCGLDRPRRCCMNRTKDRSRIESALLVNLLLAVQFVGP